MEWVEPSSATFQWGLKISPELPQLLELLSRGSNKQSGNSDKNASPRNLMSTVYDAAICSGKRKS